MTTFIKISGLVFAFLLSISLPLAAGTAEQEKAFVEKYKVAFEAGDKATLNSFLYTQGANPTALEFYKMMQLDGVGGKLTITFIHHGPGSPVPL